MLAAWRRWAQRRHELIQRASKLDEQLASDECDVCNDHIDELKAQPQVSVTSLAEQYESGLGSDDWVNVDRWQVWITFKRVVWYFDEGSVVL